MASDDLFVWLNALWDKSKPEGTFPAFVAHRFLASDRLYANAARILNEDVRDPAMAFSVWQALLPEEAEAPRLVYPAPKKRPEAEKLTQRMMSALGVRRRVAEEMQRLIDAADRLDGLYAEFGVERDGSEMEQVAEKQAKRKMNAPVGLLAQIAGRK